MHGGRCIGCIDKLDACMFRAQLLQIMVVLAGELDDVFQVIQVLLCAPACLVCTIACTASRRVIDVTTPRH